mgnify:CR=1 FL=1
MKRRPSAAMLVALLALFVALGGPAQAARVVKRVTSADVQDGGKRYVIRLRNNVKFHNGKTLGSADVVASLKRWGVVASPGKAVFKNVEAVEAKDPLTVEIRLKEPSSALLTRPPRRTGRSSSQSWSTSIPSATRSTPRSTRSG